MNNTDALWKDIPLYWMNFMMNINQALALFRQTPFLSRHKKNCANMKINFFFHLINVWVHFTNNIFPLPKKILNQSWFFLNL